MRRRSFLKSLTLGGASLPFAASAPAQSASPASPASPVPGRLPLPDYTDPGLREPRTLLFLDYFPLMRCQDLKIRQATAEYLPEGRFIDPSLGEQPYSIAGSVPFYDPDRGLWIRLQGYPDLYAYESEDAIRWRISPQPDAKIAGERKAPNQVYRASVPGFGSSILHDPEAEDGYVFKMLVLEFSAPTYHWALEHPESFWHPHALEAKAAGGPEHFHARKHSMLVSRDGVSWELRRDFDWGTPPLITEEHYTLYRNHHTGEYGAVHRARWGDRRLFLSTSPNCEQWAPLRQMLHPDVLDEGRIEFHGCSVNRYDSYYIGMVWYGNYTSFDAPAWAGGPDATHLAYSYDGQNFVRGHRQPIIPLRQPGQPPLRGLWTRGILPKDDSILIYSDSWEFDPDALEKTVATPIAPGDPMKARRENAGATRACIMHRLRKDGFTYLEPVGEWGQCQTMFLTLFDGELTINADASAGELHFEIGEIGRNNVVEGFSYDDCIPMVHADATAFPLRFRGRSLQELTDRAIYVRFKLKRSRLYAMRGTFSFDPTQRHRIEHGMTLPEPTWIF